MSESEGKAKGFHEDEHDTLWFEDRIFVPNNVEIGISLAWILSPDYPGPDRDMILSG